MTFVVVFIFTQPVRHEQDVVHSQSFKQSKEGFEFWVFLLLDWLPKAKEPTLLYYSSIARGRTDRFMLFSRALAQSEIQTAWPRTWTWVAGSISYDDNHYVFEFESTHTLFERQIKKIK